MALKVPCGKCLGCMKDRAGTWALRCYHESQCHTNNSFLTITYDDYHCPNELVKDDLQQLIRRIRTDYLPHKIRFYGCGEYGDLTKRPHYHCLIFGADFRNGTEVSYSEKMYISQYVNEIWGKGFVTISDFTMATACYTAGYVAKKVKNPFKDEFQIMSRGLGFGWLKKYWKDIVSINQIVVDGQQYPVPPAYIRYAAEKMKDELASVKRYRKKYAEERADKLGLDVYRELRAKQVHLEQSQEKTLRKEKI